MTDLLRRATAASIAANFRKLGLRLPDAYQQDLATLDRITNNQRQTPPHDPHALVAAIATAHAEGRDPADDPDVTRHAIRHVLTTAGTDRLLEQDLRDRRTEAAGRHAEALCATLDPIIAEASETLAEARRKLRDLDLRDPHYISTIPTRHLATYGHARDALTKLTQAAQAAAAIHAAAGTPRLADRHRPLILARLDAAQLAALPTNELHAAAHGPHQLTLARPADLPGRVAHVQRRTEPAATR